MASRRSRGQPLVARRSITYTDKSTRPQDLLRADGYKSTEEIVKEFNEKLAAYIPDDFDWESHIGFFQYAAFA